MESLRTNPGIRLLWSFLIMITSLPCFAQWQGSPLVKSYARDVYHAGLQNWDVEQDSQGRLYFANSSGLLVASGLDWDLIPLPGRTVVRSLAFDDAGRLYAGGQNEIGYFSPDPNGQLAFHSFLDAIPPEHQRFEDVWEVEVIGEDVFWRASGKLYHYDQHQAEILLDGTCLFVGRSGETIIAQDREGVCWQWSRHTPFRRMSGSLGQGLLTEVHQTPTGKTILLTETDGLYHVTGDRIQPWTLPQPLFASDELAYALASLPDGKLAIGSSYTGITILDSLGHILLRVNKKDGLPTNKVICLFTDRNDNLWAGLDNGIAQVLTSSPISLVLPDEDLQGVGYASLVKDRKLYCATNNGLFRTYLPDETGTGRSNRLRFSMVKGSIGQAWGLNLVHDRLYLAHDKGAFEVRDSVTVPLLPGKGTWMVLPNQRSDNALLLGTYDGVYKLDPAQGHVSAPLGNLAESARFVEQMDNGQLWVSHPYRGIYRILLSDPDTTSARFYGPEQGLPSTFNNYVFRIHDQLLAGTENGVYGYSDSCDCFVRQRTWDAYFPKKEQFLRLAQSPSGDVWFVTSREIGFLKLNQQGIRHSWTKYTFPEIYPLLNNGWEKIHVLDDHHVLIPIIKGFLHINPHSINKHTPQFDIIFSAIQIRHPETNTLLGSFLANGAAASSDGNQPPAYDFPRHSSIRFTYTATEFEYPDEIRFRWKLSGLNDRWSPWTTERTKEFSSLPAGQYTFVLEALSMDGQTKSRSFVFQIRNPWYASTTARIFYILLALGILLAYIYINRRKYQVLEKTYQTDVQRNMAEIESLEAERVKAELEHQRRELISSTMHLVMKNETISSIQSALKTIRSSTENPTTKKQIDDLIAMIMNDTNTDETWDQILFHFNSLHTDFLSRLKSAYPELTKSDIKLCIYLKMNLSSKDISNITNTTIRGVEASRYRLRKKFNLSREMDLVDFLMNF